ncbi:Putative protein [Zobellia galactanivorans]|uniref:Uncharacterized protein n=1 Tax=Zobellia galactanivorans (strain DSM 12802 / CCUG 47099 / CIP 106680 / NCIMB 13871 / Dsij) TaxID=63186 RepID=G0L6Z7_ZOBGA|nr:Putative protein [Zobellia galactanivorans]
MVTSSDFLVLKLRKVQFIDNFNIKKPLLGQNL